MNDPNLNLLEAAVRLLKPLLDELVFVGGCITGLLISDHAAGGIRVTKDVDAITAVASYAEYETLSERLRALGLTEDYSEDAPTCRWRYHDLMVDAMPTDARILGFASQCTRRRSRPRRVSRSPAFVRTSSHRRTFSRRRSKLSEAAARTTTAAVTISKM